MASVNKVPRQLQIHRLFYFIVSELASEIEKKQDYFNSQMQDFLALEKSFVDSWNVINSVIAMKKGRPSINGGKLINSFPPEFIDRYQNSHSVFISFQQPILTLVSYLIDIQNRELVWNFRKRTDATIWYPY